MHLFHVCICKIWCSHHCRIHFYRYYTQQSTTLSKQLVSLWFLFLSLLNYLFVSVLGYKTTLTPPLFTEVPVPSQESQLSCIGVSGVSILPLILTFFYWIWNCSESVACLALLFISFYCLFDRIVIGFIATFNTAESWPPLIKWSSTCIN